MLLLLLLLLLVAHRNIGRVARRIAFRVMFRVMMVMTDDVDDVHDVDDVEIELFLMLGAQKVQLCDDSHVFRSQKATRAT